MVLRKGHAASAKSRLGKAQRQSLSRQVLLVLKRLTGTDINALAAGNALPLDATGGTQRGVCMEPRDIYSLTPEFIRQNVYTWKRPGYRQYRRGTKAYKDENNLVMHTCKLVQEIQDARAQGLYELRPMPGNMGHGLFNLRHTNNGHVLTTSTGEILRADFSNPLTVDAKKDTTLRGEVTQSEVDVNDALCTAMRGGKKTHRFLNGLLQYVNHACTDCATHTSGDNWTCGASSSGVVQRWWQLLPGVEITICYGEDDMYECYGPHCKPELWRQLVHGQSHKGFRVRKRNRSQADGGFTYVKK